MYDAHVEDDVARKTEADDAWPMYSRARFQPVEYTETKDILRLAIFFLQHVALDCPDAAHHYIEWWKKM